MGEDAALHDEGMVAEVRGGVLVEVWVVVMAVAAHMLTCTIHVFAMRRSAISAKATATWR